MEKIEEKIHRELIAHKKTLALAESCTGGAIAARLTAIPDTSRYFLGSIVAYCNQWKETFLAVSGETLSREGAVSPEVVEQMVEGVFIKTRADYALAVSGIAGPSGGTPEKPVGTVYIGVGRRGEKVEIKEIRLSGDRASVIEQTVEEALSTLCQLIVS